MADVFYRNFQRVTPVTTESDLAVQLAALQAAMTAHTAYAATQFTNISAELNAISAEAKVYGADIWIKSGQPETDEDYVWIDTNAIKLIRE